MKTKSILLVLCGLGLGLNGPLHAQQKRNVAWVESGKVIENGVKLHDEEKYADAIREYRKVSRNDTGYVTALYELSFSYLSNKNYDECIKACREGIALDDGNVNMFYMNMGSALDEAGKPEEALKVYDEGLKRYPFYTRLLLNKAITLRRLKKEADAVEVLKKCVSINPFYASAHYQLGMLCAKNDKLTQAYLSLQTFLLLENNTDRALQALKVLEAIGNRTYEVDADSVVSFKGEGDNFSRLDAIIKSKTAMSPGYKLMVKSKFDLLKQVQIVMEKLEYQSSDKGFWMQFYVPIYTNIKQNHQEKALLYALLAPVGDDETQRQLKREKSDIDKLASTVVGLVRDHWQTDGAFKEEFPYEGKFWPDKSGDLVAVGEVAKNGNEEVTVGQWYYFYDGLQLKSEGKYNRKGLKDGIWKYYYDNGQLKANEELSNGEMNGAYESFYRNGERKARGTYKQGEKDGDFEKYYESGQLESVIGYKNGKVNGKYITYNAEGIKTVEANTKDDQLEGELKKYYATGELYSVSFYKEGSEESNYKAYYKSGALSAEGIIRKGNKEGEWKYYFKDKSLKEVETYDAEGNMIADKTYFKDGKTLEKDIHYEKGVYSEKDYDKDGKLCSLTEGRKKHTTHIAFYDKSGKVLGDFSNGRGNMDIISYNADGSKHSEGTLRDGQPQGEWKYYYHNGKLSQVASYENGEIQGVVKDYYKSGKLYSEIEYDKGQKDGYAITYQKNGKINTEGYYRNGEKEGEWLDYYLEGALYARYYYISGTQEGYQEYYHPNGKLQTVNFVKSGILMNYTVHDSSGRMTMDAGLKNGTGEVKELFADGTIQHSGKYEHGCANGTFRYLYPNGKLNREVTYKADSKEGTEKQYDIRGMLRTEMNWLHNNYNGTYTYYDVDGTKSIVMQYDNGNAEGVRQVYYPNGKLSIENAKSEDENDGYTSYYAMDGTLQYRLKYDEGRLIAYSYLGKDGKVLEDIPVKNETVKFIAYFPNGNKSAEVNIVDGARDGAYKLYHSNGKLAYTEMNVNGLTEGAAKQYYDNGKPSEEYNYINDEYDGLCRNYYENGNLCAEINYHVGKKLGPAKYYDKTGKLTETHVYVYDEAVR